MEIEKSYVEGKLVSEIISYGKDNKKTFKIYHDNGVIGIIDNFKFGKRHGIYFSQSRKKGFYCLSLFNNGFLHGICIEDVEYYKPYELKWYYKFYKLIKDFLNV